MRYAITGSRGFIGTALTKRLQAEGHTVLPVSRHSFNTYASAEHYFDSISPDAIIHLAAFGNHYNQVNIAETIIANAYGTLNVFMGSKGVPVYNFTTSSINLPVKTPYSITKQIGAIASELFPNVINVMPYSVYGPGEAGFRFIPTVINALLIGKEITLDESATHDWIFIDSFVNGFLNGHREIGTGTKYTNIEVVKKLEIISGKKLRYKPGKLRRYDNGDWVCKGGVEHLSIEEGLLKTFNHYK